MALAKDHLPITKIKTFFKSIANQLNSFSVNTQVSQNDPHEKLNGHEYFFLLVPFLENKSSFDILTYTLGISKSQRQT